MLRNPIYSGCIVIPSFQVNTNGDFDAIVSKELFLHVQNILDGNTSKNVPHKKHNTDFPLRRFMRCAKCGTALTGSWSKGRSKKYAYYRCRNSECKAVNVRKENLEELFIEKIYQIKPKPEYMSLFKEIVTDVYRERLSEGLLEAKSLEKVIRDLKNKKSRLIDLRLEEKIDQGSYQEKLDEIISDIQRSERELIKLNSGTMDIDSALSFAERVIGQADELWKSLEFNEQLKLQNLLFPDGLEFDGEKFGTAKTNSVFSMLAENAACNNQMAIPGGIEPPSPA